MVGNGVRGRALTLWHFVRVFFLFLPSFAENLFSCKMASRIALYVHSLDLVVNSEYGSVSFLFLNRNKKEKKPNTISLKEKKIQKGIKKLLLNIFSRKSIGFKGLREVVFAQARFYFERV